MPSRQHILRGRSFVNSKPSKTHFSFLDRLFDHVAHMENDKKVQENNGQHRIENEGVIHEGNLTTKPINKKPCHGQLVPFNRIIHIFYKVMLSNSPSDIDYRINS